MKEPYRSDFMKTFVVFYCSYGHIHKMANVVALGAGGRQRGRG
jgi:hypothetical protein